MRKYEIYDSKAESFLPPFYYKTQAVALRDFAQAANDDTTPIGKFGADFTIFETATWDQSTGIETPHKVRENLGTALQHQTPFHNYSASDAMPRPTETTPTLIKENS